MALITPRLEMMLFLFLALLFSLKRLAEDWSTHLMDGHEALSRGWRASVRS